MHKVGGVIYNRGCWRCGGVDKGDREPCGDGRLNRPRKRRMDTRQGKNGLNKTNMTGDRSWWWKGHNRCRHFG